MIDTLLHEQYVNEPNLIKNNHNNDTEFKILWRSTRIKRSTISDDYIVYLQEYNYDIGMKDGPVSFKDIMNGDNFELWLDTMKDEMKFMIKN